MARGLYTRKFALDEPPSIKKAGFRKTRHFGSIETAIVRALSRQRQMPSGKKLSPTSVYNLRTGKTVAFIWKSYVEIL
jgi:hypothetical protein